MKKISVVYVFLLLLILESCHKKKLTEVVEVPLPTKEEKMTIGTPEEVEAIPGKFELIKLPYHYDALEPNIDAMTMEMHYSKHYLTFTNNLNKLVAGTDIENQTIEEALKKLDPNNEELKNNLGGYYNHTLFWESITPKGGGLPKDTLAAKINADFGSYDSFKSLFKETANKQFGSGWAWLIVDKTGKLQITSTPNQDNPLMPKQIISGTPILALDLWEHAYYLKYQYKKSKYIDVFFDVIDWKKVGEKYEELTKQ